MADDLIDDVEGGEDLDNTEAAKIYDLDVEKPPVKTLFKKILLGTHAQYRMDLRGISVPEVRAALATFNKAYLDGKSRNDPIYRRWADALRADTGITWTDPRLGLTIVFAAGGRDPMSTAKIITTYRDGGDRPSSVRVARRWQASLITPGYKTLVTLKSELNLPLDTDREPDVAAPAGSAMPGGSGRDIPRMEYNGPDSGSDLQPRTLAVPGEQYGHPTKFDYNTPTRRSFTGGLIPC